MVQLQGTSLIGSRHIIQQSSCKIIVSQRRLPRLQVRAGFTARPYTVRQGDTLESIAEKRDITTKELLALNHDINEKALKAGQTIILPANKLSKRDKEILAGIGKGKYRTYPARAGETINDIISKRNISRAEVDALNPDVNLNKLSANQIIKLPANKYTVREREMLQGTANAPAEFFAPGNAFSNSIIVVLVAGVAMSAWLFRQKAKLEEQEKKEALET
eukprot:jgi/Botrbrau1/7124/Bobra.0143s0004.1